MKDHKQFVEPDPLTEKVADEILLSELVTIADYDSCISVARLLIPIVADEIKRELEKWMMGHGLGNEAGVKYDWDKEWQAYWKGRIG